MTEPDDELSLEMVTAALRMDSADVAVYARVLSKSLSEALPADYVTVERERSMSDRMRGRPGEISKIAVQLGDQVMTLAVRNGQPSAEICRQVRGVVLSTKTVPLQQWASALASALVEHAESNAQAAQALRRLVTGSLSACGRRIVVIDPLQKNVARARTLKARCLHWTSSQERSALTVFSRRSAKAGWAWCTLPATRRAVGSRSRSSDQR
jgi:phage portal protein BeeE